MCIVDNTEENRLKLAEELVDNVWDDTTLKEYAIEHLMEHYKKYTNDFNDDWDNTFSQ